MEIKRDNVKLKLKTFWLSLPIWDTEIMVNKLKIILKYSRIL